MKNKINQLKKQLKNERGLTLVELLAVIVILAIISIIAFVFIGGIIENSKKDAHIANAQQVISAVKLHEATEGDIESQGISIADLQGKNYLEKDMVDPWTKESYEGAMLNNATVTKSENNVYTVTNFNTDKCKITATDEQLRTGDRDEICGKD